MSVTCACARLKAVVLTLARLLEIASSWRWAASMPVTEMCCETSTLRHLSDVVDRAGEGLVLGLEQVLVGLVGAHQVHRLDHRFGHVDVRAFQKALVQLGG